MARNKLDSGKYRLAVGISIIWLASLFFFTEQQSALRLFLLFGVLPVIIGWTAYWIYQGFNKDARKQRRNWPWRR